MEYLLNNKGVYEVINLGTGRSYSVLEVIDSFEKASGIKIPYDFLKRRRGDISECFTDPTKASKIIGWQAKYDLKKMCEDSWRWQIKNPNGIE